MKKIAVVNDLSGLGRCSLTAAISVLSAMGVQACPLPTAILTSQTGYPSYYLDSYTDKMEYFRSEWEKLQVRFDGIYTGYVSERAQILNILKFVDTFHKQDTFLLVDPVMGDDGRTYQMYSEQLRDDMKKLVSRADYTTPNLTELCLLTGVDFNELPSGNDIGKLMAAIETMGRSLCDQGTGKVIVTGIGFAGENGTPHIGNMYITPVTCTFLAQPRQGGSYSGTGDLFASVLAGGISRGDNVTGLIDTASKFISEALIDSVANQVPPNDGINFETYLSMLMPGRDL